MEKASGKELVYEFPGKNIWSKNTLYAFKSEEKAEGSPKEKQKNQE